MGDSIKVMTVGQLRQMLSSLPDCVEVAQDANGRYILEKPYGVFILDNIDGGCILAIHEDGSPVVFATDDEAHEWGNDNYPSYFANHPNSWESYGLEIRRA